MCELEDYIDRGSLTEDTPCVRILDQGLESFVRHVSIQRHKGWVVLVENVDDLCHVRPVVTI